MTNRPFSSKPSPSVSRENPEGAAASLGNLNNRKSILSSLTALGVSELPAITDSIPRNSVIASVAAAGVSLLACQSADAGTISVFTPNVNVGYAAGDASTFHFNLASILHTSLALRRNPTHRTISFWGISDIVFRVSGIVAAPGAYGKKFSQVGTRSTTPRLSIVFATSRAIQRGSDFSQEYFAFYFLDTSSLPHYGWIYGSVTGGYSDLTYNLISYAYETTPDVKIAAGDTGSSATPEPSTAVLGAMAALILGAAGVRKWNKARA